MLLFFSASKLSHDVQGKDEEHKSNSHSNDEHRVTSSQRGEKEEERNCVRFFLSLFHAILQSSDACFPQGELKKDKEYKAQNEKRKKNQHFNAWRVVRAEAHHPRGLVSPCSSSRSSSSSSGLPPVQVEKKKGFNNVERKKINNKKKRTLLGSFLQIHTFISKAASCERKKEVQ